VGYKVLSSNGGDKEIPFPAIWGGVIIFSGVLLWIIYPTRSIEAAEQNGRNKRKAGE